MTTIKQAQANRRNAKKSTGPKTQGGKLMSSKNAITYGIFSSSPLLPSESEQDFEALKKDVMAVFPPVDAVAAGWVERIILGMLRQRRLRLAEAAKLQISITPEIMAEEISDALALYSSRRLTANSISDEQEATYNHWVAVLEEMENLNIQAAPSNTAEVSIHAPKTYAQLKTDALKDVVGYNVFMKTPAKIIASLESTKKYAEDFVAKNAINHTAYKVAQQMKLAKLIPDNANLALLSKYQVQLDTDIERAIQGYKNHITWRSEMLEVEVEEVTEDFAGIAA